MTPVANPAKPRLEKLCKLCKGKPWQPGQMAFDPRTRVLLGSKAVPLGDAHSWALMATTWRGHSWWYGWFGLDLGDAGYVDGYMLVPRNVRAPWEMDNG